MARLRSLRVPRPKKFLLLLPISTANTLLLFVLLLNKASGIYGLLAPLTGAPLSSLQATMYIYSVLSLVFVLFYLVPHIRATSSTTPADPFKTLLWAYFYALDALVNMLFTVAFAFAWFFVVAQHDSKPVPGAQGVEQNAGFTAPELNVSRVEILATPKPGLTPGQEAVAVGAPDGQPTGDASLGTVLLHSSSIFSIMIVAILWSLRIYSILVVMAYARMVVRKHVARSGENTFDIASGSGTAEIAEDPFRAGRPEGEGWKGRMGRAFVGVNRSYWLGKEETDDEEARWMEPFSTRFKRSDDHIGVKERERRRRSGTDPPKPRGLPDAIELR
ncbi:DUF1753-domain-containing protein [Eremomyces bilateralis CBS 781.70]|uniref:DUF1753-domain-containing protein n=1 Tax=Eremomyces bilateralis CBS 781.70 TaxID=1392243 RepID=A0A6G1GH99_9PEZI|nr:DUF1753-domain-containing protein [Eremomyces bilateralis CBS 781.70]KAF1817477.1 DUF1753-domain-containing protein [Eremomyces bilateralis CBS 781.70]